ncbi:MAG: biopolymer transporter ExbD [Candidatus Firestonebacteria bacterium]|nr:biopolymer transporter ExbD [Candidatus Firestonebacteria bacterium]
MQSAEDDSNVVSGINVTPLVDITLVLLIIFMVTATFVSEQGLKVNLPKVLTRENAPSPAISVALGRDGRLKLMKKDVTLDELKNQMALEARLDPTVKVLVKIDKDLPYNNVAEVLDAIKLAGINKVALAMDRK